MEKIVFYSGKKLDFCVLDKERHLANCLKWINSQEINKFLLAGYFPLSPAEEEKWFDNHGQDNKNIVFALETKENKHNGNIGLHKIDWIAGTAEMGIVIGEKEEWRKGYGSSAEAMMLTYAFRQINLRKVYGKIMAPNTASLKAAQKNGAQEEGRLKKHLFCDGAFQDVILMSFFKD